MRPKHKEKRKKDKWYGEDMEESATVATDVGLAWVGWEPLSRWEWGGSSRWNSGASGASLVVAATVVWAVAAAMVVWAAAAVISVVEVVDGFSIDGKVDVVVPVVEVIITIGVKLK